jgi:hypothetical protein
MSDPPGQKAKRREVEKTACGHAIHERVEGKTDTEPQEFPPLVRVTPLGELSLPEPNGSGFL